MTTFAAFCFGVASGLLTQWWLSRREAHSLRTAAVVWEGRANNWMRAYHESVRWRESLHSGHRPKE